MDVEINEVYFDDDPIDTILKSLNYVENKHRSADPLEIIYPNESDKDKRIGIRITENSVFRALEIAGRKAGFNVSFSPGIADSFPRARSRKTVKSWQSNWRYESCLFKLCVLNDAGGSRCCPSRFC